MTKPRRRTEAEYRLRVAPHVNERTQQPCTLVVLQTTKDFANFRYELAVDERLEGRTLHLKVLGLKAPQLDLPAAGPAEFRKEYSGLNGEYTIVVCGLDGSSIPVGVRITPRAVTLTEPPGAGIIAVDFPSRTRKRPG
ncbi:MAG: hypothetical protein AB1428_11775 [Bacteroidota bacterium]